GSRRSCLGSEPLNPVGHETSLRRSAAGGIVQRRAELRRLLEELPVTLRGQATAHELDAQEEIVGLDHVATAVLVDLGQPAALPQLLHAGAVDRALTG